MQTIVKKDPHFVTGSSWRYKRILGTVELVLFVIGVLIYAGQVSIGYKEILEYAMIITVVLYFATFTLDFKKKYMGVEINEYSGEPAREVMNNQNNQHVLGNPLIVDPNTSRQYEEGFQNSRQFVSPSVWREMGPAYPH